MVCQEIIYTGHAVARMFERGIQTTDVSYVIESGEVIADYPDDSPLPSFLLLGWAKGSPLHVVIAYNEDNKVCYVITCYIPDTNQWQQDFKSRR